MYLYVHSAFSTLKSYYSAHSPRFLQRPEGALGIEKIEAKSCMAMYAPVAGVAFLFPPPLFAAAFLILFFGFAFFIKLVISFRYFCHATKVAQKS